jgi:regulator of CtrA degradation
MQESMVVFGSEYETTIPFAERFVSSEAFRTLFREGMALVEQTAVYLDGDGREESRNLDRLIALAYATESMRLTTRLMQTASWLLVQRAVAEGEISLEQARKEKHRARVSNQDVATAPDAFEQLPERLRDLIAQSLRIHERIRHLDSLMNSDGSEPMPMVANPIAGQLDLLRSAFLRKS